MVCSVLWDAAFEGGVGVLLVPVVPVVPLVGRV
jgi:hypothetical protein